MHLYKRPNKPAECSSLGLKPPRLVSPRPATGVSIRPSAEGHSRVIHTASDSNESLQTRTEPG